MTTHAHKTNAYYINTCTGCKKKKILKTLENDSKKRDDIRLYYPFETVGNHENRLQLGIFIKQNVQWCRNKFASTVLGELFPVMIHRGGSHSVQTSENAKIHKKKQNIFLVCFRLHIYIKKLVILNTCMYVLWFFSLYHHQKPSESAVYIRTINQQ